MTSEQWEEATEVDLVVAKSVGDTEPAPAPPPTEPANEPPARPFFMPGLVFCEFCDGSHGDHDPACPYSTAVAP